MELSFSSVHLSSVESRLGKFFPENPFSSLPLSLLPLLLHLLPALLLVLLLLVLLLLVLLLLVLLLLGDVPVQIPQRASPPLCLRARSCFAPVTSRFHAGYRFLSERRAAPPRPVRKTERRETFELRLNMSASPLCVDKFSEVLSFVRKFVFADPREEMQR